MLLPVNTGPKTRAANSRLAAAAMFAVLLAAMFLPACGTGRQTATASPPSIVTVTGPSIESPTPEPPQATATTSRLEVTATPHSPVSPKPAATGTPLATASPASGPLPTPAPLATPIPPPTPTPVPVTWAPGAPNIIFIVTDDMTFGMVKYMSELQDLLIDQGASFDNFFVTTPLCCPARSTILTGQYAHNHGVHHNSNALDNGGFNAFFRTGREASTIATALDAAGYETALFGKYLNGYALKGAENYVPPGWDEWYAFTTRRYYYNSTLNENGTLVDYGGQPSDYSTDVLTTKTVDFVRRQATKPGPFFAYVSPYAPHLPAIPSQRDLDSFQDVRAPRDASFNEADTSDKPRWVQRFDLLDPEAIVLMDNEYRQQIRSLQAIDVMVARIVGALLLSNQLHNTYIIFTSDNGMHMGSHRLPTGKGTAYDTDIRVPFFIRGPGITPGSRIGQLSLITDIVPTLAELGTAKLRHTVDGRSLMPLFDEGSGADATWRQNGLIEYWSPNEGPNEIPSYRALRSRSQLYVEWQTGEIEFYDMASDPFQIDNLSERTDPELLSAFSERLALLSSCKGLSCKDLEDEVLP